jgi:hypothetical protein
VSCPGTRKRLGPYLGGDLGDAERTRIRAHLESCTTCAAELDALQRTVGLLAGLPDVEAPPHLAQRIIARLRDGEGEPGRFDWLLGPLGRLSDLRTGMAALALALLTVAVLRGGGPDAGERADALRAALRETPAAAPDLELGPNLGAAAAPESKAPSADAVLDQARHDPLAALRALRALPPSSREAFIKALGERAQERGEATTLATALRVVGDDAAALAAQLDPGPGSSSHDGF